MNDKEWNDRLMERIRYNLNAIRDDVIDLDFPAQDREDAVADIRYFVRKIERLLPKGGTA